MTDQLIQERIAHKKKIFLARLLWLILFIFFLNFFATFFFSWYWTIWWFDMFMHFLGGLWISSMAIWLYLYSRLFKRMRGQKIISIALFSFLAIVILGLLWELFEFGVDTFITIKQQNISDTLSDLLFDLLGGMLGTLYFLYKQRVFKKRQQNKL